MKYRACGISKFSDKPSVTCGAWVEEQFEYVSRQVYGARDTGQVWLMLYVQGEDGRKWIDSYLKLLCKEADFHLWKEGKRYPEESIWSLTVNLPGYEPALWRSSGKVDQEYMEDIEEHLLTYFPGADISINPVIACEPQE